MWTLLFPISRFPKNQLTNHMFLTIVKWTGSKQQKEKNRVWIITLSLLFKDNCLGEGERERVNAVPDWNKAMQPMKKRHCWRMFQFYDIIAHALVLRKYARA